MKPIVAYCAICDAPTTMRFDGWQKVPRPLRKKWGVNRIALYTCRRCRGTFSGYRLEQEGHIISKGGDCHG